MAYNKLRRQIEGHLQNYGTGQGVDPEAVMTTMRSALTALGGPVADNRPVQETIAVPQADGDNTPLVGRDLGDETAHISTDMGKTDPLEYCP